MTNPRSAHYWSASVSLFKRENRIFPILHTLSRSLQKTAFKSAKLQSMKQGSNIVHKIKLKLKFYLR